jgi:hypothetical protein
MSVWDENTKQQNAISQGSHRDLIHHRPHIPDKAGSTRELSLMTTINLASNTSSPKIFGEMLSG